jgi:hypothetical protein
MAILKFLGSNESIMKPKIFDQEQIARAVEIGLGVSSPSEIEIVLGNKNSWGYKERIIETFLLQLFRGSIF